MKKLSQELIRLRKENQELRQKLSSVDPALLDQVYALGKEEGDWDPLVKLIQSSYSEWLGQWEDKHKEAVDAWASVQWATRARNDKIQEEIKGNESQRNQKPSHRRSSPHGL